MEKHPEITEEQRRALREGQGPVYLVDVNSSDQYVLMPADEYQHYRALFESDTFDITETYPAQEQALGQVWNASEADVYDQAEPEAKGS